jgi:hypothetical protein
LNVCVTSAANGGGLTMVKDYVLVTPAAPARGVVVLWRDPRHAQADFGEALAVIDGVERQIHFFAMDLPHSDAGFAEAYPAEISREIDAGVEIHPRSTRGWKLTTGNPEGGDQSCPTHNCLFASGGTATAHEGLRQ